jgi:hypothetical protein
LQNLGRPWTSHVRSASVHTDTFLMISGLLVSYSFYKRLERTKRLDLPREYVSRLMRYSTQFCVKCVSRLIRYSTQFCVKYVSTLMRYSTQFCVKTCCYAVQVCFVVRNITIVSCEEYVAVVLVAIYLTLHSPNSPSSLITNSCAVRTSHTATVTRYSGRNKLLSGRNVRKVS